MKRILLSLLLVMGLMKVFSQDHSLVKVWETDSLLKVPESVLPDLENKVLYVSNIDGLDPWGRDGRGSIGKIGLDGQIIAVDWIRGLNAPKGMGIYKNTLYVADLNELVIIDIKKGEVKKKIEVPNAVGLNDITVDPKGVVYISDSKGKKVYVYKNNSATPYLEGLQGPNGVLWYKDNLYVLDKSSLHRVEYDRRLTKLSDAMEGGADGVEPISPTEFIVSCWAGSIYYVYADGKKQLMLDTRQDKMNSADIGFDPVSRMVYVPTFWRNSVVAYELK